MTLSNNIINLFKKIVGNKKKSIKILNLIDKLESKGLINYSISVFLLKVFIIIISYYPNKANKIISFLKIFYKSETESKNDLVKLISKFNVTYYEDNVFNDINMDSMIFNTFDFICNIFKINKELSITLLNEILLNTYKIKTEDKELKVKIYLLYLRNANHILLNSLQNNKEKSQIYLKIVESCGVTTRLINSFLNNI